MFQKKSSWKSSGPVCSHLPSLMVLGTAAAHCLYQISHHCKEPYSSCTNNQEILKYLRQFLYFQYHRDLQKAHVHSEFNFHKAEVERSDEQRITNSSKEEMEQTGERTFLTQASLVLSWQTASPEFGTDLLPLPSCTHTKQEARNLLNNQSQRHT